MDFQINMGIKLQGDDSNLGPPAKPSFDTMLKTTKREFEERIPCYFFIELTCVYIQEG